MKKKRSYVCDVCGYESPAWFSRCPSCHGGTLPYRLLAEGDKDENISVADIEIRPLS